MYQLIELKKGEELMHRRVGDWYDIMQVCVNGHKITEYAQSQPEYRQKFCANCGEPTIDACPSCGANIRGHRHLEGVLHVGSSPVPKYCINCGMGYPWQLSSIENLKEVLKEGGLTSQDIQEVEKALPDIVRDTKKSESAALKMKRILGKLGKDVYGVAVKVVSDIASEAAKKALGLK